MSDLIPPAMIGLTAPLLAEAYTHANLDGLFLASGFPGDPPLGSRPDKCMRWMREANNQLSNPIAAYARLIAEFMDGDVHSNLLDKRNSEKERIRAALEREGLRYVRGGKIVGGSLGHSSKSLSDRIQSHAHETISQEFDRAVSHVDNDPPAAVTAASAVLEALCKQYLQDNGIPLPTSQTLGPLWSLVSSHLGLSPKDVVGSDLKQILSGLSSIAAGVAALRTHKGSAHGHSKPVLSDDQNERIYQIAPRHARLAVHAAHTMATFILETWDARRSNA